MKTLIGLSCEPSKIISVTEDLGFEIRIGYTDLESKLFVVKKHKLIKSEITNREMLELTLIDNSNLIVAPSCVLSEKKIKIVTVVSDISDWKYYNKPRGERVLQTRYFSVIDYQMVKDKYIRGYEPVFEKEEYA